MDSQLFYLLNFILGGIFLFWFFIGRKSSSNPTPLNLKAPPKKNSSVPQAPTQAGNIPGHAAGEYHQPHPDHEYPVKYTPRERDVTGSRNYAEESFRERKRCLFVYNGHDWDAFEVLGVTPDSTLPQVTAKYQLLVKNSDEGRMEFLESAYRAILRRK